MTTILRPVRLIALAFCLTLSLARGAVFNFSYTFGDGVVASGSLNGTQNGLLVESVTGVSLFFNGTPAPGSIFASKYDPDTFSYMSGPVVSFDALQNNFVFSNSNLAGGDFGYDSLFYIFKPAVGVASTAVGFAIPLSVFGSQNDPTLSSSWLLEAAPLRTVPDAGSTGTLVALAMLGLVALRRKLG